MQQDLFYTLFKTLDLVDVWNNAWLTVYNEYWSRVRWFANGFHEWRSQEWKSLAKRITSDQNRIVIDGNSCTISLLACFFMSWTHNSATNNHRSLIPSLSLRTIFSDLALWRHHKWSVTWREREALALVCHTRRLFLHVQIGALVIFTSK